MGNQDSLFENDASVSIDFDCMPFYNYALAYVFPTPVRALSIENGTDYAIPDLTVRIDSATDLLTDRDIHVGMVPAGETVDIDCSTVIVDVNRLLQLTEAMADNLKVEFAVNGEIVFETVREIRFFAFDQWLGPIAMGSIAAFVTPNHPALAQVVINASRHLEEWTGSSAFTGYQAGDPSVARMQAAALYRAVQEWGIVYNNPPASFTAGQRVRMADAVLEQHMATCLDFTILYASLAEAVGLNPLVVFIEGHAFPGVWLEDSSFQDFEETDYASLSKRCAKGVEQMTVFQSTDMAHGRDVPFEQAEIAGRAMLNPADFQIAVDVHRARAARVLPLPTRIMGEGGWQVEVSENALSEATRPKASTLSTAYIDVVDEVRTKKQVWERSLLDLSMNNMLLNMKMGRRAMPVFIPAIDEVEDTLALQNDLIVAPRIEGFPDISDDEAFGAIDVSEEAKGALYQEFKNGRLHTPFTQAALGKVLDNLFRSAKSSLEETGANTLFMALGTLKWIDKKRGGQERLAPIMLFPIDIVRKSAKAGYIVRFRDDEPQINISLVEMLRADYGIAVDGLDPLPKDDAGVDTRLVLNTFVNKVMDQDGWEVFETAVIGLFSFGQFVMWNDIRSHEDELRNNKIVDSMMEGRLTWMPGRFDSGDPVDPSELLLPVEADASQLFAIKAAVEGNSFVLHGPPGTGKSQTITAIIANALARGKKVLFVAEKMAALEVVERRLDALGLSPFCLEVHSTKATKNHVFEQIQQASEIKPVGESSRYAAKLAEVQSLRVALDRYSEGISARNAAGLTLREQISLYVSSKENAEPIEVGPEFAAGIASPEDFSAKMNAAERIVTLAQSVAPLSSHPLRGIEGKGYTPLVREQLPGRLGEYRASVAELHARSQELSAKYGWQEMATRTQFAGSVAKLREALAIAQLPGPWRILIGDPVAQGRVLGIVQLNDALQEARNAILATKYETFLSLGSELGQEWASAQAKGLFGRNKAIGRVVAQLQQHSKAPVDKDDVDAALRELASFREREANLAAAVQSTADLFGAFKQYDGSYDWRAVRETLAKVQSMRSAFDVGELSVLADAIEQAGAWEPVTGFLSSWSRFFAAETSLKQLIGSFTIDPAEPLAQSCEDLVGRVEANADKLREWMTWNEFADQARALGLGPLVDYLNDAPAGTAAFDAFKSGVYRAMCFSSMSETGDLGSFASARFDQIVSQYIRADGELRVLAKDEIYRMVAGRSPDLTLLSASDGQAANLQRALRSRGRNVSIRSILAESGDVVRELCPCFLMSPLSVAQYLEPGKQQFDLLIFDEASQMQTCKAVGALSRAKEAVIVGDPRQMPPTSFFQGKLEGEDFDEVLDLESILEDCLALNMPQTYLKWHYRSQHESLIAFSNKRFYESKMLTFPSVDDRTSRVEFVKVDGFFDRGGKRVNTAEAEAVVGEILRRYRDPALRAMSVGVVTFNIPQQTLIQDLFQRACADDPGLEKWATEGDEPLFVKNLENVQGDERDAIIFSVTYAPDKSGKMSMNFGPINREGGWRRLNVAVTRARVGMRVFSSMEPGDIDLNRTSSQGPASLQAFLSYAQRGTFGIPSGASALETKEDVIAIALCERLEEMGYKTKRNVGRSSYKVDVAVVDPYDDSRYLAGILLDGSTYQLAKVTRDREIAQPSLLRRLGWKCMRLWVIDWWEDPAGTASRVANFLGQAEVQAKARAEKMGILGLADDQAAVSEPSRTEWMPEDGQESALEIAGAQTVQPDAEVEPEPQPKQAPIQEPLAVESAGEVTPEVEAVAAGDTKLADIPREEGSDAGASPFHRVYEFAQIPLQEIDAIEFSEIELSELAGRVEDVLAVEAPIEQSLLIKRITLSYGLGRVGSKIQKRCEDAVRRATCKKVSQAGRDIIWRRDQDPKAYLVYRTCEDDGLRRSVNELPLEELVAAAADVLGGSELLSQSDLVKAIATRLGYKRVTAQMNDFVKKGVSLGVRRGVLEREGDFVKMAKDASSPEPRAESKADEGARVEHSGRGALAEGQPSASAAKGLETMGFEQGDLVFIDVETPNRKNDSICSICVIRTGVDGRQKAVLSSLVNPDATFDAVNVGIHGITERDVKGAPTLSALWKQGLGELLAGARIVGHNVRFDLSVLDKALDAHGIDHGSVEYACTMSLASDGFPELDKYSLDVVCSRCGVALGKHHDAESDARACMEVFFFLEREYRVAENPSTWVEYEPMACRSSRAGGRDRRYGTDLSEGSKSMNELISLAEDVVADGRVTMDEVIGLRWWIERNPLLGDDGLSSSLYSLLSRVLEDGKIDEGEEREVMEALKLIIDPLGESACPAFDVSGKKYCLSGDFEYGSKEDVEALLAKLGGERLPGVSKKCDYVIVGAKGSAQYAHGKYGKKIERAIELQSKGVPIQIVGEHETGLL